LKTTQCALGKLLKANTLEVFSHGPPEADGYQKKMSFVLTIKHLLIIASKVLKQLQDQSPKVGNPFHKIKVTK